MSAGRTRESFRRRGAAAARRGVLAAAFAAVGAGGTAAAQHPGPPPEPAPSAGAARAPTALDALLPPGPDPLALALVVSSGASLGAYEGGFLHVVVETVKRNPDVFDLKLVTGSSAGSVNGLLAVLASCGPLEDEPTESAFFAPWMAVGFEALFVPEEVTAVSVFSRRVLERVAAGISTRWEAGLRDGCDVVFGATATRVTPRRIEVASGLHTLPRTEEKFLLRVRGRGPGRPPELTNYVPANPGLSVPLLPLDAPPDARFRALRDLLFASAAFPVAFAPVPLAHCLHGVDDPSPPRCAPEDAREELFLDGGILDYQPLRLAARAAAAGLRPDPRRAGRLTWTDRPRVETNGLPEGAFFLVIDPQALAFPHVEAEAPPPPEGSVLALVERVFEGFVSATRTKELVTVLEESPSIRARLAPSHTMFPTMSGPLLGFLGFFDAELRAFDFLLGMHDAFVALERRARPHLRALGFPLATLDAPHARSTGAPGWRRYACVRATLESEPDARARCAGDDLRPLRALLQVTLERLYATCARAAARRPAIPPPVPHAHCSAAQAGAAPPSVVEGAPDGAWRRGPDEGETEYVLRRLAAYRYPFRDLGLGPDEAERAPAVLRAELAGWLDALAAAQDGHAVWVEAAGRVALDPIGVLPPRHVVHLAVGPSLEAGWSGTDPLGPAPWLRASVALEVDGYAAALASRADGAFLGLAPLVGVEVELLPLSGAVAQPRLGVRVGPHLSSGDRFFGAPCEGPAGADPPCSRLRLQPFVACAILDRLRLQVSAALDAPVRAGDRRAWAWAVRPALGWQF